MKKTIVILLIIFTNYFVSSAQSKKVPILKPLYKTNRLLCLLSKGSLSKDSCLTVYVNKVRSAIYFDFHSASHKSVNISMTAAKLYNRDYGYVQFKGINIFIIGGKEIYDFFNKTNDSKAFSYIDFIKNANDELILSDFEYIGSYEYKRGKFKISLP